MGYHSGGLMEYGRLDRRVFGVIDINMFRRQGKKHSVRRDLRGCPPYLRSSRHLGRNPVSIIVSFNLASPHATDPHVTASRLNRPQQGREDRTPRNPEQIILEEHQRIAQQVGSVLTRLEAAPTCVSLVTPASISRGKLVWRVVNCKYIFKRHVLSYGWREIAQKHREAGMYTSVLRQNDYLVLPGL